MQALDAILSATPATDPWPARRLRADELTSRYPHAADILRLYGALLDPQEDAFHAALSSPSPLVAPSAPSPLVGEGRGGGFCPSCGGLPQLSYHALSGEPLVSGPRYLLCARCSQSWIFSRMTCASCGESDGTRLPIYQESERFPHARVDGCATCQRYLLTFDLRRDSRAVPIVDELACLPLDLYARDQGLTKIATNLMGN